MSQSYENDRAYMDALNELHFSEESKSRMTQALLNAQQPIKRRTHRPVRIALIAAAACVALTITAIAAVPTIWSAVQADQGIFAPYAQTIEGAVSTDQGIEIQVLSALCDDVRGWVYFSVRDVEKNQLDKYLILNGNLDVSEDISELNENPEVVSIKPFSSPSLGGAKLISYDSDSKTALFVQSFWFGEDANPVEKARLTADGMTTQNGYLSTAISCASVTSEVLDSQTATESDTVIFSFSDVTNAAYDDSILPDKQVVLAPGQTPMAIEGNEDIRISSMGFASDGCFHVRLEFAEGVEVMEYDFFGIVDTTDSVHDEDQDYFTLLARRVENGLDILFPLIQTDEAGQLSQVQLYGSYARPGVEIQGDWLIDFEMTYHASTVLSWTGEVNGLQVTQVTVSPLSVTLNSTGKGSFSNAELRAVLKDGSMVTATPSMSTHLHADTKTDEAYWENYNTWEFSEPVDVENIVSLTLLGEIIPVESGK